MKWINVPDGTLVNMDNVTCVKVMIEPARVYVRLFFVGGGSADMDVEPTDGKKETAIAGAKDLVEQIKTAINEEKV
jgi:hypothetical protein